MNQTKLEITTTRGQLDITTQKAKVQIRRRRPTLSVVRNRAAMTVNRKLPTMRVSREQIAQLLGRGPVLKSASEAYQTAFQNGLDAVARIASDGTQLSQIESGSSVGALTQQNMLAQTEPLELNTMSLPPPTIEWEPGYLNIDWSPGSLHMQWDVSAWADITVEPHHVEIRLKKHPEVAIKVHYKHEDNSKFVDKYL